MKKYLIRSDTTNNNNKAEKLDRKEQSRGRKSRKVLQNRRDFEKKGSQKKMHAKNDMKRNKIGGQRPRVSKENSGSREANPGFHGNRTGAWRRRHRIVLENINEEGRILGGRRSEPVLYGTKTGSAAKTELRSRGGRISREKNLLSCLSNRGGGVAKEKAKSRVDLKK